MNDKADLQVSLRTATDENTTLTVDLATAEGVQRQLQHDKAALQVSLRTATDENTTLTVDLTTAEGVQRQLQADLGTANARVDSLRTETMDVEARHRALEVAVGTVTQMEEQAGALQVEIDDLLERRRPLILSKQNETAGWFACTGSMEPVITCLDSATWAQPLGLDDIVVGSIISFPRAACWPDASADDLTSHGLTSHRVIDTRVTGGVTHYWPKGDGNREADGCWVPHSVVAGYLVELHKNVYPENAYRRNIVNAAATALTAAEDILASASTTFALVAAEYREMLDRYCGVGVEGSDCVLPDAEYKIVSEVWYRYGALRGDYDRAYTAYEKAYKQVKCERSIARRSRWPGDAGNTVCINFDSFVERPVRDGPWSARVSGREAPRAVGC